MPFGLTNVLASFQELINDTISREYLDDVRPRLLGQYTHILEPPREGTCSTRAKGTLEAIRKGPPSETQQVRVL